jgi:hypothetical protein
MTQEKRALVRKIHDLLPPKGLFLVWEPTRLEGEDKEGWMDRFRLMRPKWSAISDEEFSAFESHSRASDYPETAATWLDIAREAGFREASELLIVPNQLARAYRFRH